jgi:hypothetical protein
MRTHIERGLVFTDLHGMYQDKTMVKLITAVAQDFKPHIIVDNGDTCDYGAYSKHDKSEKVEEKVDEDHVMANIAYDSIFGAAPKARKIKVEGNHDFRQKLYWLKYPDQYDRNTEQTNALNLKKRGFKEEDIIKYKMPNNPNEVPNYIKIGKLYFTHGVRTGETAVAKHLGDFHANFVMGHIHKTAIAMSTNIEGKPIQGYAVGCSCQLRFNYAKTLHVNHGLGIWYMLPDGTFIFNNVTVINYKTVIEGQLYDFSNDKLKKAA